MMTSFSIDHNITKFCLIHFRRGIYFEQTNFEINFEIHPMNVRGSPMNIKGGFKVKLFEVCYSKLTLNYFEVCFFEVNHIYFRPETTCRRLNKN